MSDDREYQRKVRLGLLPVITTEPSLKQIEKDVTKKIVDCYEPESSCWRRNYTDRAEWYFLWWYKK